MPMGLSDEMSHPLKEPCSTSIGKIRTDSFQSKNPGYAAKEVDGRSIREKEILARRPPAVRRARIEGLGENQNEGEIMIPSLSLLTASFT